MSFLPKTQLQADLDAIDRAGEKALRALSVFNEALNGSHAALWKLPGDRILAILNHWGVPFTLAMFGRHNAIGLASNAALEGKGVQAIVVAGREITVNQTTGLFEFVPEPEPEPVVEL